KLISAKSIACEDYGTGESRTEHLPKRPHSCRRTLGMVPDRAADRQEIGAGFDQRPPILRRNAADRDARDLEQGRPPGENRRVGPVGRLLGTGWKEGTEGDIVGA